MADDPTNPLDYNTAQANLLSQLPDIGALQSQADLLNQQKQDAIKQAYSAPTLSLGEALGRSLAVGLPLAIAGAFGANAGAGAAGAATGLKAGAEVDAAEQKRKEDQAKLRISTLGDQLQPILTQIQDAHRAQTQAGLAQLTSALGLEQKKRELPLETAEDVKRAQALEPINVRQAVDIENQTLPAKKELEEAKSKSAENIRNPIVLGDQLDVLGKQNPAIAAALADRAASGDPIRKDDLKEILDVSKAKAAADRQDPEKLRQKAIQKLGLPPGIEPADPNSIPDPAAVRKFKDSIPAMQATLDRIDKLQEILKREGTQNFGAETSSREDRAVAKELITGAVGDIRKVNDIGALRSFDFKRNTDLFPPIAGVDPNHPDESGITTGLGTNNDTAQTQLAELRREIVSRVHQAANVTNLRLTGSYAKTFGVNEPSSDSSASSSSSSGAPKYTEDQARAAGYSDAEIAAYKQRGMVQ